MMQKDVAHIATLAEQSSRKRARTKPTTPAFPATHKTSNSGKKKLCRRQSKKTDKAQRVAMFHIALFRAIKVPTGKICGWPLVSLTLEQNSLSGYKPLDDNPANINKKTTAK